MDSINGFCCIINDLCIFADLSIVARSFANWNVILVVIVLCSIISCTVFIERLIQLRRARGDTEGLLSLLQQYLQKNDLSGALQTCKNDTSSISRVFGAALSKYNKDKESIENSMEVAGMLEVAKLEKNAKVLSIMGHVTPLIGLLGTVLGFIRAFGEMSSSGLMDITATQIGEAMEYALVTTAAGLIVAIPAVLAYNYILSKVNAFVLELQTTTPLMVDMLIERQQQP